MDSISTINESEDRMHSKERRDAFDSNFIQAFDSSINLIEREAALRPIIGGNRRLTQTMPNSQYLQFQNKTTTDFNIYQSNKFDNCQQNLQSISNEFSSNRNNRFVKSKTMSSFKNV